MRRNKLAKLTKHTELAYGWFGISFFHLRRVTELKSHANHFFLCFNQDSYGMAVKRRSVANCNLEYVICVNPFRSSVPKRSGDSRITVCLRYYSPAAKRPPPRRAALPIQLFPSAL